MASTNRGTRQTSACIVNQVRAVRTFTDPSRYQTGTSCPYDLLMTRTMDDAKLQAAIQAYAKQVIDEPAGRPVPEEALKLMREMARTAQQSLEIREAARRTVANMDFEWTDERRARVEAIIRADDGTRIPNTLTTSE